MNLYLGLDNFRDMVGNISEEEKYKTWLKYYETYQEVFDLIFKKLYMVDLDSLRPVINSLDFVALLSLAEKGLKKYPISKIEEVLNRCVDYFQCHQDFDVYLLVGFGHIDGSAPPSKKPLLFFGLERLADSDINVLIPHEFNHFLRFHTLNNIENTEMLTVKQLIIAEGLATITPLILNHNELTDSNFAKALMISEEEYSSLIDNTSQIKVEIQENLNQNITPSLMERYFMANDGGVSPKKSGYYYGLMIITTLIRNGFSLKELTVKKTDEIYSLYSQYAS